VLAATPSLLATWIGDAASAGTLRDRLSVEPGASIADRLHVEVLDAAPARRGRPSAEGGRAARAFLDRAIALAARREVDGLVTAPLSKQALALAGYPFSGHTEILQEAFGVPRAVLMLCSGERRVAFATHHVPLREVPARLSIERILETVRITAEDLRRLFDIARPRIAVCGLNPHAGEGGRLGDEEGRIVEPAVERANALGIDCAGPFPADSIFLPGRFPSHDAIVALYHDQGTIPAKMWSRGRGFNVTLGLPTVRTSPDHGTAFDIAGRGSADPAPMASALRAAVTLATHAAPKRP